MIEQIDTTTPAGTFVFHVLAALAWAMATFIEATETSDEGKRKELMDRIIAYNREDLEATWEVFQWLKAKLS